MDPLKNRPVGKSVPQGVQILWFVSGHMKENGEAIHFHMKSRGVQGIVFPQITFEKCATTFYFQNSEVGTKIAIVNL